METVAVKDGIDKYSAILKHPEVAAGEIREATARALKNKRDLSVEIDCARRGLASVKQGRW